MSNLTYCEVCLEPLDADMFDYRFDYPVCFECVEKNDLESEEWEEPSDDFPMYLEYDEG